MKRFSISVLLLVSAMIMATSVSAERGLSLLNKCSGKGSPDGTCSSSDGHFMVDNCRCNSDCKGSGSWYCENSEGKKIKGSGGGCNDGTCKETSVKIGGESQLAREPLLISSQLE